MSENLNNERMTLLVRDDIIWMLPVSKMKEFLEIYKSSKTSKTVKLPSYAKKINLIDQALIFENPQIR